MAAIDEAILAMLNEVEHIAKDKKNTQQNYNFRGIDDVYNAVHPLLSKHGVYPTCDIVSIEYTERETQKGGTLLYARGRFKYTFHAKDGSSVTSEALGEAMDSGDKASNKAMSAAYKYSILQLLCIPTMAIDGDGDSPLPTGNPPPPPPPASADSFGSGKQQPKPKQFAWSTATSAERKDYALARIATIKKMADPVQATEKLKDMVSKLKVADFQKEDLNAVIDAAFQAERDIDAECASGS